MQMTDASARPFAEGGSSGEAGSNEEGGPSADGAAPGGKSAGGQGDAADRRRIDLAFAAEARRRAPLVFRARTFSLIAAGALLIFLIPFPEVLYYHALIIGFVLVGFLQFRLGRAGLTLTGALAFVTLDMALIVFTLIYPSPIDWAQGTPPQVTLRYGGFIFIFLILSGVAISLSPRLIFWSGAAAAAFWAVGVAWLASLPDSQALWASDAGAGLEALIASGDPRVVDLGVQAQNIVVLLIVAAILAAGANASRGLLVRETALARRAANLSRYLPAETVETLAGRDDPFGAEAEREAAVLFTDIVGFSALAERIGPRATLALLRRSHSMVERAVFAHHGAIDKFIGDGVMATFGAYRSGPKDAANAIACAGAILKAVDEMNAERPAGEPPVVLSVGLHFGPVLVGDVGAARRMEFAVIGDTVNVAARLEEMTRQLGVAAAISDEAMAAAGRPPGFRRVGESAIRGREEAVTVWTTA